MDRMNIFEKAIADASVDEMKHVTPEEAEQLKSYDTWEERIAWLEGYGKALNWSEKNFRKGYMKVLMFMLICSGLALVGSVAAMIIKLVMSCQ